MNPEIKEQWVAALRSGDYAQGQGTLRTAEEGYCCLGVLVDLAVEAGVVEWKAPPDDGGCYHVVIDGEVEIHGVLPDKVREWADLSDNNPVVQQELSSCPDNACEEARHNISGVNDDGQEFGVIADIIEEQL